MPANAWAEVTVDYGTNPPHWHVKYAWMDGRRDPITIEVSAELIELAQTPGSAYHHMLNSPAGELWLTPDGRHRFRETGERTSWGSVWEKVGGDA